MTTSPCPILSLPPEVFSHLVFLAIEEWRTGTALSSRSSSSTYVSSHSTSSKAESTQPTLRWINYLCQTCRSLYHSPPSLVVRYLVALQGGDGLRGWARMQGWDRIPRDVAELEWQRDRVRRSRWPLRSAAAGAVLSKRLRSGSKKVKERCNGALSSTSLGPSMINTPPGYKRPGPRLVSPDILTISKDGMELRIWATGKHGISDEPTRTLVFSHGSWDTSEADTRQRIDAYDLDVEEGVVVVLTLEPIHTEQGESTQAPSTITVPGPSTLLPNITLPAPSPPPQHRLTIGVYDYRSGQARTSSLLEVQRAFRGPEDVQLEVCGSRVMIRAGESLEVRQWRSPTQQPNLQRAQSPSNSPWPILFARPLNLYPLLTASLLSSEFLFALSHPTTSSHGLDWGSTLEIFRVGEQIVHYSSPEEGSSETATTTDEGLLERAAAATGLQSKVADIQLPIRAKPIKGLSYIACSLGKVLPRPASSRSADPSTPGLLLLSVEGYLHLSPLSPFLSLLYPSNALSLFGATYPTLDSHWVRGNMCKPSLSPPDVTPLGRVGLCAGRVAAIWYRPLPKTKLLDRLSTVSADEVGAGEDEEAEKRRMKRMRMGTTWLRTVNADQRLTEVDANTEADPHRGPVTGSIDSAEIEAEAEAEAEAEVHTMFTGSHFYQFTDIDCRNIFSSSPSPSSSSWRSKSLANGNSHANGSHPLPSRSTSNATTTTMGPRRISVQLDGDRTLLVCSRGPTGTAAVDTAPAAAGARNGQERHDAEEEGQEQDDEEEEEEEEEEEMVLIIG